MGLSLTFSYLVVKLNFLLSTQLSKTVIITSLSSLLCSSVELTTEQYHEFYRACLRLTQQFNWHIRWVQQVPGGELIVIAQSPENTSRRIIITIRKDGQTSYGTT